MILIRKALPSDAGMIARFQEKMALETENIELDPVILGKGVDAVFDDPARGCYYIAEIEGTVAGSLLTTYEWSDWRNGVVLWIQSVYVLPEYRKLGIFRMLYSHIKEMVEANPDFHGIRLYVDKTNTNAMRVYSQIGMDGDHYRLFEWMNPPCR